VNNYGWETNEGKKKKKELLSDINYIARKDLAFFNQAFQLCYNEQI
jgi:hypothetical protein